VAEREAEHREIFYAGRVQGVGFRYTVRSLAAGLNVTGFVRNLPDGRVHVVVEGEPAEVKQFLDAIAEEMSYYIHDVQQTKQPATGHFDSFVIKH
jgi:acylphosphatase